MWLTGGWIWVLKQVRSLTCDRWCSTSWFYGDNIPCLAVLQENALLVPWYKKWFVLGNLNLLVSKCLFQCEQLKAEYNELKCQFLIFKELKKVSQLPCFGRVLSFKSEGVSFESFFLKQVFNLTSGLVHFLLSTFWKKVWSIHRRGRSYSPFVLQVYPSPEESAATGLKGQRAGLCFDKERTRQEF